jgi:hypothetical protein
VSGIELTSCTTSPGANVSVSSSPGPRASIEPSRLAATKARGRTVTVASLSSVLTMAMKPGEPLVPRVVTTMCEARLIAR